MRVKMKIRLDSKIRFLTHCGHLFLKLNRLRDLIWKNECDATKGCRLEFWLEASPDRNKRACDTVNLN